MQFARALMLLMCSVPIAAIAHAECHGMLIADTVCTTYHSDGTTVCHTDYKYYEYCTSTSSGGNGCATCGGGDPGYGSYYDSNMNGRIDVWRGVIETTDPCANNLDVNDRLGTSHGGTNTVRPNHSGVDLQANSGDWIYPVMDGTVISVGAAGSCGFRVLVGHAGGITSSYCHMIENSSSLQPGNPVYAGYSPLGRADSTGDSSGNHLHITIRDQNGNVAGSFYDYSDQGPGATHLNDGGC